MEEAAPEFMPGRAPLDARASPRSSPGRAASRASRWHWPRYFPSRRRTTCCGCGWRRAASIPIATCASPSCRRPTSSPTCRAASIDGYCVGEPWNQQSESLGHRPHRRHRPRHLEGHAGEGAGHHRVLGRTSSQHAEGADQGADRGLRRGSTNPPTAPRPPASCRARAISTRRRRSCRARSTCPTSTSSIAAQPTFRGAAMPTGSWRRWCAGSRRRADIDIKAVADRVYRTDHLPRRRARDEGSPARGRSPAAGRPRRTSFALTDDRSVDRAEGRRRVRIELKPFAVSISGEQQ